MGTTTQCNRLLAHLKSGKAIDPMKALSTLGIYRLGARVYDLRREGHPITRTLIEVPNRFGDRVRVAQYKLASRRAG